MIKFFRHIRKKLIEQNDMGKYFKYAIGEILLVVIGILIALQINNWNENKKERKREHQLLSQIAKDLQQSYTLLRQTEVFFEAKAQSATHLTGAFSKGALSVIQDSLAIDIYNITNSRRETPLIGTIESLIYSGDINVIESEKLKNDIISYLAFVEAKLKDIERFDETYYRPAVIEVVNIIDVSAIKYQNRRPSTENNTIQGKGQEFPFPNNFKDFLSDRHIYAIFQMLEIAHRNQAKMYGELGSVTEKLYLQTKNYLSDQ